MTLYDPKIDQRKFISFEQTRGICVGKPAPHVELRICVDGSSDVGRILTRGPHVMLRYWNGSPAKASAESSNGVWLDTGDIGSIDDYGNVWLIGRANGRIKSGGENIYPEEVTIAHIDSVHKARYISGACNKAIQKISSTLCTKFSCSGSCLMMQVERTLLEHPGVTGVVVVGIPDARLTEMVVACVQIRENWQWVNTSTRDSVAEHMLHISSENLWQYCKEKSLTGYCSLKSMILCYLDSSGPYTITIGWFTFSLSFAGLRFQKSLLYGRSHFHSQQLEK